MQELSQLAWEGVESNKTLFHENEISTDVLQVANRTGILSKVRHRYKKKWVVVLQMLEGLLGGITGRPSDVNAHFHVN